MPISRERKIIFVHIPKTGGTSIEYALDMHGYKKDIGLVPYLKQKKNYHNLYGAGLQHMTLQEISYAIRISNFTNYKNTGRTKRRFDFVKAMVSDPYFSKGYFDANAIKNYFIFTVVRNPYARLVSHFAWLNEKWYHRIPASLDEFEHFVYQSFKQGAFKTNRHLIPQHLYISGLSSINKILIYEKLEKDFGELCKKLDLKIDLPTRMKSNHDLVSKYYTNKEIKKLIFKIYKKDFELFGYHE